VLDAQPNSYALQLVGLATCKVPICEVLFFVGFEKKQQNFHEMTTNLQLQFTFTEACITDAVTSLGLPYVQLSSSAVCDVGAHPHDRLT